MTTHTEKPLISVLLPAFNAQNTIAQAIESILNQTYKNIELIILNDGSTDDTLKIAKLFSEDTRVRIVSKENTGLIDTLNLGIDLSRGAFIARMDSDDIAAQTRFERQIKEFLLDDRLICVG